MASTKCADHFDCPHSYRSSVGLGDYSLGLSIAALIWGILGCVVTVL